MRKGILLLLVLLATTLLAGIGLRADAGEGFVKFENIFEPSGVQQLPDGRFLVVEDEPTQPVSILTLGDAGAPDEQALFRTSLVGWFAANRELRGLEDLEDVTLDSAGRIYAISSHSRKANGQRDAGREQLLRFALQGTEVADLRVYRGLRKAITRVHEALKDAARVRDVKDDDGFNIEGLSFDRERRHLLIGLRSPVIDEQAVIVTLLNPDAVFDADAEPQIAPKLIRLDLDRGGIRAMAWDEHLGGYLIVSRRPEKSFKLWLWRGGEDLAPRRLRLSGVDDLRQAEGVTPVLRDGRPAGILIVSDEGDGLKEKPGRFLFVDYSRIEIE